MYADEPTRYPLLRDAIVRRATTLSREVTQAAREVGQAVAEARERSSTDQPGAVPIAARTDA